jgi:hypothetical protein
MTTQMKRLERALLFNCTVLFLSKMAVYHFGQAAFFLLRRKCKTGIGTVKENLLS